MGPSKFIAPLKKSGLSSFSSPFSSSSSLGSGNQDVKRTEVLVQSEHDKAPNSSGFNAPSKSITSNATTEVSKDLKQVDTKFDDQEISKSMKTSDGPPQKKKKSDLIPSSPNVLEFRDKNEVNDDKENICPVKAKKLDKCTKPCVSLTDEEYERLFNAVLRQQSDNAIDVSTEKNNADPRADHSKDMFEFSQSDLDDSKEEQSECTAEKDTSVKGNDVMPMNASTAACDNQQMICKNSTVDNPSSSISTSLLNIKTNDTKEFQTTEMPQNNTPEDVTNINKVSYKSQTKEADSKESSAMDFETLLTSTPVVEKRTLQSHSDFTATPEGNNYSQKILGLSQEQNRSPASSVIKAKVTPASSRSQASELASSPAKTLSTSASQSSQVAPSPTYILKQPTLFQTSHSSQGSCTPACTPKKMLSVTSKNSELLLLTPIKQVLANSDVGSSTPNTPSGSQKISQELCLTPPPSGKTAKERLLWLQKKRLAGVWVQCDENECQKWRYLKDCHDPTTLPKKWFCRMHPDEEFNSCDAQEKRLSLHAEEDMIFNKYSPGSLVWAKLSGYPWWPAMVEDDPDLEQFYWLNEFSDIPNWYHVVFFDDEERTSRCRAWVQVERLKEFQEEPFDNEGAELIGYKKRVISGYKIACLAKALSPEERLAQYSFASCYKGPIGGFTTRQYNGPVGYREPVSK